MEFRYFRISLKVCSPQSRDEIWNCVTLILWCGVFHEKFVVAKLVMKFRIFKELKVHYRVDKSPPYDSTVKYTIFVWILTSFFSQEFLILSHILLYVLRGFLAWDFPLKMSYIFLVSRICNIFVSSLPPSLSLKWKQSVQLPQQIPLILILVVTSYVQVFNETFYSYGSCNYFNANFVSHAPYISYLLNYLGNIMWRWHILANFFNKTVNLSSSLFVANYVSRTSVRVSILLTSESQSMFLARHCFWIGSLTFFTVHYDNLALNFSHHIGYFGILMNSNHYSESETQVTKTRFNRQHCSHRTRKVLGFSQVPLLNVRLTKFPLGN